MTTKQAWALRLLVWVLAPPSTKGSKKKSKNAPPDPVFAAMIKVKGNIHKYIFLVKEMKPAVVYHHEKLDPTFVVRNEQRIEPDLKQLSKQLKEIQLRVGEGKKRLATEKKESEDDPIKIPEVNPRSRARIRKRVYRIPMTTEKRRKLMHILYRITTT